MTNNSAGNPIVRTLSPSVRTPNSPENPMTKVKLNTFDPIILPTAISALPFNAALTDTANSGSEVPIAIPTRATISLPTPKASPMKLLS